MCARSFIRRSAGAVCPLFLLINAGCQTVRAGPPEGAWARRAAEVAACRLDACRTPDREPVRISIVHSAEPARPGRAGVSASEPSFMLAAWSTESTSPTWAESLASAPGQVFVPAARDDGDNPPAESEPPATQPASERGPLPGFFETLVRDGKRTPRELWRDTKNVYTNTPNLVILGLAGAASIALHPEVDHQIADHFEHHHMFPNGARSTFEILGNPGIHWAVAGTMYIASQQLQATKEYEVARTLVSALIINDLSTLGLQVAAWQKDPSGRYFAWPSGHTSSTMTVAAVMHQAYGPLAGAPLYGLTTLVAIERLDDHDHWFSDVIFGGAMGWVIGHTVAGGRLPEIGGGQIVPYVDPLTGCAGVAWWKSLK